MDRIERAQIRLLLDHLASECRARATERNSAMHADHSARGILRSGATVKAALQIAEELASALVNEAFAAVTDVAQGTDVFSMVLTDVTITLSDLKPGIDQAVRFATGTGEEAARFASVANEANRLFLELQQRTVRLVELHRFSLTRPSPSQAILPSVAVATLATGSAAAMSAPNRGGKPLAAHWDDLWSSIAVQLWNGDLQPKTQADIKRAMLEWFIAKEIEVGETAVTDRARQLWLKIEATK